MEKIYYFDMNSQHHDIEDKEWYKNNERNVIEIYKKDNIIYDVLKIYQKLLIYLI